MYYNTLPPGRYAMLLRKSREDEEAERHEKYETLQFHELQLKRLASTFGISIAEEDIYRELQSGEMLAKCKHVMELVEAVSQKRYTGVLVVTGARLTRGDPVDRGTIISAFAYSRTLIVTPQRIYNPTDENDLFMLEIELLIGRRELGNITYQFQNGKINKTAAGQYLGSKAPFGWTKTVVDRKKTLVPSSDAKTLIQWYEDLAARRVTTCGIADDLNRRGITTPLGNVWTQGAVAKIIRNPVNKGMVRWGANKTIIEYDDNMQKRKKRVRANKDEWIEEKGLHDGIVSEELWQAAVNAIQGIESPRQRKEQELRDPLAGLLKCSRCGRGLHRRNEKSSGERYVHSAYNRHECWQVGATVKDVIKLLAQSLREITEDLLVTTDSAAADRKSALGRISILEKDIGDARNSIERLFILFEKEYITDEEFHKRRIMLDTRIEETERQIELIRGDVDTALDKGQRITLLKEAIGIIENYEGRVKVVNVALKRIIERIDYSKSSSGGDINLDIFLK